MLNFRPVTLASMQDIYRYLPLSHSNTCDFTVGGIFMWIEYFDYRYCIQDDTLFILGRLEDDRREIAFSLPLGALPLSRSVGMIEEYCRAHGLTPNMSAVPEDALPALQEAFPTSRVEELVDWGDYLYDSRSLATLTGHRYNKKRNRVNKFAREYPGYEYRRLMPDDLPAVRSFFEERYCRQTDFSEMARYENGAVLQVLDHYAALMAWGFSGGYIVVDGNIVAFTIGEVLGNTLYVHIEKALYDYAGSYETINYRYAADCCSEHPEVLYINREDDAGDAGLREVKMSYNPLRVLKKYDVFL